MHTSRLLLRGFMAVAMCTPSLVYAATPPSTNVNSGAMGNASGLPANLNGSTSGAATAVGNASGLPQGNPVTTTNTVPALGNASGLPAGTINTGTTALGTTAPLGTSANPGNLGGAAVGNASGLPPATSNNPSGIAPNGTSTPQNNVTGTGTQNNLSGASQ